MLLAGFFVIVIRDVKVGFYFDFLLGFFRYWQFFLNCTPQIRAKKSIFVFIILGRGRYPRVGLPAGQQAGTLQSFFIPLSPKGGTDLMIPLWGLGGKRIFAAIPNANPHIKAPTCVSKPDSLPA